IGFDVFGGPLGEQLHLRPAASPPCRGRNEVARQADHRKRRSLSTLSAGSFLLEQVDTSRFQEGRGLFYAGGAERSALCAVLCGACRHLQPSGRRRISPSVGGMAKSKGGC